MRALPEKEFKLKDKLLIIKKAKIKKIADLYESKNKMNINEEEDDDFEDKWEALDEDFFKEYFRRAQLAIDNLNQSKSGISTKKERSYKSYRTTRKSETTEKEINEIPEEVYQEILKKLSYVEIAYTDLNNLEGIDTQLDYFIKVRLEPELMKTNLFTAPISSYFKNRYIDFIERLDLSHNKIESIPDSIGEIKSLRFLNLSYNNISDLNKIRGLEKLKVLRFLNLTFNLVCRLNGYRQFVIEMCPVLEKLDGSPITEKELDIIHYGASKFGEIRENGNGRVIEYPKKNKKYY